MSLDLASIILGMKVRQARLEANMNLSELATRTDLSASYVTEIEKGRKYPKADKIMKIAQVLGKNYDEIVSIKLSSPLNHLETILSSRLIQQFPFEEFGLNINQLIDLLTRTPNKGSALLRAILDIARQYDMKEENFLRASLRSYQEVYENYFPDIEKDSSKFSQKFNLNTIRLQDLEEIITKNFGYELDYEILHQNKVLSHYRSVFIDGKHPKLLLNSQLYPSQLKFLIARELGYRVLNVKERANTSSPETVDSFQQVLNDFRASYFAGALLMPEKQILFDLRALFELKEWDCNAVVSMLEKYDVTPEMLLYRFSEVIPQFFGIKLHFLRFHQVNGKYQLMKHLNMSQLLLPTGLNTREHFCRKWLSVRLLTESRANRLATTETELLSVGAQRSRFLESNERFLCLGFSRSLILSPEVTTSVIVGFRYTDKLAQVIRFANDSLIPSVTINETCERCPLKCPVREAEPKILQREQAQKARDTALAELIKQLGH